MSPIPLILQNLIVVLSGLLLGPLKGTATVLLFLLLGVFGFPVFSGGHGGLAWFAGPTGGYLAGYLLAAPLAGLFASKRRLGYTIIGSVLAFLLILLAGALRLKLLKNIDWSKALLLGVLPFLPGDLIKAGLAAMLSWRLGPFVDSISGKGHQGQSDV